MDDSSSSGRRSFINWFLGTSVGALAVATFYPVARFLSPPEIPEATTNEVDAGPVNDPEFLEKSFKIIRFGLEPVIVVRVSESDFLAYAATCTHLDCIVGYQSEHARLWCNCHNGAYDLSGQATLGPPPKGLEKYNVNIDTSSTPGKVIVSKI